MTDKQKNLIVRSITGILFVVCMVSCFLNPRAMIFLFTIITGLSIWEYCGLVNNEKEGVTVNRLICTIAGVYFFLAVAGLRMGIVGNFIVFVPYLLTIVYLFIVGYAIATLFIWLLHKQTIFFTSAALVRKYPFLTGIALQFVIDIAYFIFAQAVINPKVEAIDSLDSAIATAFAWSAIPTLAITAILVAISWTSYRKRVVP